MYSTCLFCSGALGRNESIEHFAVGRRLAFDAAKGRLWVICPQCNRWNLTPLESRLEAIEEAERAYRATKLRSATEHIGLAKLKEGTELVRIGQPLLPEFAAWRYGKVFKRRMHDEWKAMAIGFAPTYANMAYGWIADGTTVPSMVASQVASLFSTWYLASRTYRVRVTVEGHQGKRHLLSSAHAATSFLLMNPSGSEFSLRLMHRSVVPGGALLRWVGRQSRRTLFGEFTTLEGDVARRAFEAILPVVNRAGAPAKEVSAAVTLAADGGNAMDMLTTHQHRSRVTEGRATDARVSRAQIGGLPAAMRLAMEMVTHEADERRALDGELHVLEARWREAEEIASIADSMFLPSDMDERLGRMRAGE